MKDNQEKLLTVAEFRRKGFRVDINHLRRVKGAPGVLALKWHFANHNLIDPHGGETEACLVDLKGRVARGTAKVSWRDAYNRKIGIHIALKRALENLENV
jgi:hypothetical protein